RIGRITLVATILGSSIAFIDGSVVNVALPAIQNDLGGGLAAQQWVVDAYLLTLGSLVVVGGSLGDISGQLPMFTIGVAAFGIASWRWIFIINVPIALVTIALTLWLGGGRQTRKKEVRVDFLGAVLGAAGLGLLVAGFIEQPQLGWSDPLIPGALAGGTALLV